MKPSTLISRPTLLLAALVACGCSQVVRQSYEGDPSASNLKLAAWSGTTTIYGSTDPRGDSRRLVADGYARLGESKFNESGQVTTDELLTTARDVGADIVLFSEKAVGAEGYVAPVAYSDAGTATTLQPYMSVDPSLAPGVRTVTTTATAGPTSTVTTTTSQTTVNPPYVDTPDGDSRFIVSFWRRSTNS